jgi:hypothetical protein
MHETTLVLQRTHDITLTEEHAYRWWPFPKHERRYAITHPGVPFAITFDNIDDAKVFFAMELQSKYHWEQCTHAIHSVL